jgi:hypothetical protein
MTEPRVTYRRSPINEWTRPAFRRLSDDAKLVLLAARLGPNSNMIGLSYCPAALLAVYSGLSPERVAAAERELSPEFLERDADTDELFVADALEYQVGETFKPGDKRVPHILGLLMATHSDLLRARWMALHPEFPLVSTIPVSPSDGATKAPSKPEAGIGAGAAEGEGDCAARGDELEANIQPPGEAGAGLEAPPASPAGREAELPDEPFPAWVAKVVSEAAELGVALEPVKVRLALRGVVECWRPEELSQALRGWATRLTGPGTAYGLRNYLERRGHVFQSHGEAA